MKNITVTEAIMYLF